MAQIKLYVAGFSYTNDPAGTGGQEFLASSEGSEDDKIWYQIDRSVLREFFLGEDIQPAYLGAADRAQLDQLGVTYNGEQAVKDCGMGSYVLWRREE